MIKKIFFSLLIVLLGITLTNAQCTPDSSYTAPGFYPDSFPHADVGTFYSTIMTIIIPEDTVIDIMGVPTNVTIDSMGIIDVQGLPDSFYYDSSTPNGHWPGNSSGCILISGNPIESQTGTHSLTFIFRGYGMGTYYDYSVYRNITIDNTGQGVNDIVYYEFDVLQNSPNPFSDKIEIVYTTPVNNSFDFVVYNFIGDIVYKKNLKAEAGINKLSFYANSLSPGIYLYKLSNKNQIITKRMIIFDK